MGSVSFTIYIRIIIPKFHAEVLHVIGQQEKIGAITEQYHEIFVSVFVFVVKLKGSLILRHTAP